MILVPALDLMSGEVVRLRHPRRRPGEDDRDPRWSRVWLEKEIAPKLSGTQDADGSLTDDSARWMEDYGVRVTNYCLMVPEIIGRRL